VVLGFEASQIEQLGELAEPRIEKLFFLVGYTDAGHLLLLVNGFFHSSQFVFS
jgi:hypothetical protein